MGSVSRLQPSHTAVLSDNHAGADAALHPMADFDAATRCSRVAKIAVFSWISV